MNFKNKFMIGTIILSLILLIGGIFILREESTKESSSTKTNNHALTSDLGTRNVGGGLNLSVKNSNSPQLDLLKITKEDIQKGDLKLSITPDFNSKRDFTLQAFHNFEPISINYNNQGEKENYKLNLYKDQVDVSFKNNTIDKGIITFILKDESTIFSISCYINFSENISIKEKIKFNNRDFDEKLSNQPIEGKNGKEVTQYLNINFPENEGLLEGGKDELKVIYLAFLDNTPIQLGEDGWFKGATIKDNNLKDSFNFTLPNEVGNKKLYVVMIRNPFDNKLPIDHLIYEGDVFIKND